MSAIRTQGHWCFAIAMGLILASAPSAFPAEWRVGLEVSIPYEPGEADKARQKLTAGAQLTAADGFDNRWDTVATGSAILSAYFYHPESAGEQRFLVRDFRSDQLPQQWDIHVTSNQNGQPVTIAWAPPPTSMGSCQSVALSLIDVTAGAAVDLRQPSYTYTNQTAVARHFQLRAGLSSDTPPEPPSNLASTRTDTAAVGLAWTKVNDPTVVGYHLYRKGPDAVDYQRVTVAATKEAEYRVTGLTPGGYTYVVTAVSSTGCESGPSNELTVTIGP